MMLKNFVHNYDVEKIKKFKPSNISLFKVIFEKTKKRDGGGHPPPLPNRDRNSDFGSVCRYKSTNS